MKNAREEREQTANALNCRSAGTDRSGAARPGATRCVITGAYSAIASAPGPQERTRRFQSMEQGLLISERGQIDISGTLIRCEPPRGVAKRIDRAVFLGGWGRRTGSHPALVGVRRNGT